MHIKKGLQKEPLFKGLKASYINKAIYFGFAIFLMGIILSVFIETIYAIILTIVLTTVIFSILLFYSKTYGANGFIKKIADNNKPDKIKYKNSFDKLLLWKKL